MDTAEFNTLPTMPVPSHDVVAVETGWPLFETIDVVNTNTTAAAEAILPSTPLNQARWLELRAKRVIDLVGACSGLALLAPLMLAAALLIRLDSPGPTLFKQKRLGRYGRPFWILKFRTMRPDAEQRLSELETRNESAKGVLFKMSVDPRVTRIGWVLRKTNIDELPQLWNIIKGDMSLVGPRPLQIRDSERLKDHDPESFAARLEFPPGLTGAWQVGRKAPTDSECLLDLDLDYINHWSLGLDLSLIYRTFFVLLKGVMPDRSPSDEPDLEASGVPAELS